MTLQAAERGHEEVVESTFPNPWAASAEEYWPDLEGLDYRDTVTDFALPEGTFFDAAAVHVLTTATLDRLRELYPHGRFEARRFRPNLVVAPVHDVKDFLENEDVAGWTTTHAAKEYVARIAGAEAAAESYDKARIVDTILSLNQPTRGRRRACWRCTTRTAAAAWSSGRTNRRN